MVTLRKPLHLLVVAASLWLGVDARVNDHRRQTGALAETYRLLPAEREMLFMSMVPDMSMPQGKGKGKGNGKGKGSTGTKKGSPKGGKKSKAPGDKASKSGKKSGEDASKKADPKLPKSPPPKKEDSKKMKSDKKGSKKGKGGGIPCPTAPTPGVPTSAPVLSPPTSTRSPSGDPPVLIQLTPYTLSYTFDQTTLPSLPDYNEVASATSDYLTEYFRALYMASYPGSLTAVQTKMTANRFNFNQPTEIDFTTTLVFSPDASSVPQVEDADNDLSAAFEGSNMDDYLSIIRSLPESNVFSTTTAIGFAVDDSESAGQSNYLLAGAAAAAGAGALVMIVAGVMLLRRKQNGQEELQKYVAGESGPATVAGDTVTMTSSVAGSRTQSVSFQDTQKAMLCRSPSPVPSDSHSLYNEGDDDASELSEPVRLQDVNL